MIPWNGGLRRWLRLVLLGNNQKRQLPIGNLKELPELVVGYDNIMLWARVLRATDPKYSQYEVDDSDDLRMQLNNIPGELLEAMYEIQSPAQIRLHEQRAHDVANTTHDGTVTLESAVAAASSQDAPMDDVGAKAETMDVEFGGFSNVLYMNESDYGECSDPAKNIDDIKKTLLPDPTQATARRSDSPSTPNRASSASSTAVSSPSRGDEVQNKY
jgi:hypothetical protein